jgi:hypothetical protein
MLIDSTLVISVGFRCEMVFSNANSAGCTVMLFVELQPGFPLLLSTLWYCGCGTVSWFAAFLVSSLMLSSGCGCGTASWLHFAAVWWLWLWNYILVCQFCWLHISAVLMAVVLELHPGFPLPLAFQWQFRLSVIVKPYHVLSHLFAPQWQFLMVAELYPILMLLLVL